MSQAINRISPDILAQILGPEDVAATEKPKAAPFAPSEVASNPFDDILKKASDSLEGVSKMESKTNNLISDYTQGKAELSDVMIATAKMNIAMQLAVTTVTSVVNTFKEITQIQI